MSDTRFVKLQGLGNDFLVIEVEDVRNLAEAPDISRRLCERHFGPGADGIVFVSPAPDPSSDFASRIFNADGSEAEVSGNGTRCLAAYLYFAGRWSAPEVRIQTVAGVKQGRLAGHEGSCYDFEFDMGKPILASREIPVILDPPADPVVRHRLKLGGDILEVTCTSMGNPHCSLFVPSFEGLDLDEIGPLIEHHPAFPNRTNVEFVRVVSPDEIEVRFWERGVGRTLSSGTGSCGASVASMLNGLTGRRVKVSTGGGDLSVYWRDDDHVLLTGSAEVIYEGRSLGE